MNARQFFRHCHHTVMQAIILYLFENKAEIGPKSDKVL